MAEQYKNLEKAMCKELERLDKKYTAETEMTVDDADRANILYHALKSAATYHAMKDAEDEGEDEGYSDEGRSYRGRSYGMGRSYARRRDSMGRYSRMGDPEYSGHYPMEYIDPYWDRRF